MSSPTLQPILQAISVEKSYRVGNHLLDVLRGVSLEVRRGEFLALQGSSGAGKSTLLHLFGGLDLPDRGRVLVADEDLAKLSNPVLSRFRAKHIGIVFQAYHLLPDLSAIENVVLSARIARIPYGEAHRRSKVLLGEVGLGDRMNHRPNQLSGGERQRVGIARALVNQPDLILADEPTGNLDSRTGDEVLEVLLALRASRQVTLLIATHDSRIASRAERVVHMVDGTVVAAAT